MREMQRQSESVTGFLTDFSTNVGAPERLVSAAAGGALVAYGIKQGGVGGTLLSVLGGALLFRGATGHSYIYDAAGIDTAGPAERNSRSPFKRGFLSGRIHVTKAVTINRPVSELYQFWKNFENFPQFMKHVESVTKSEDNTWHWKAKAPLEMTVEWEALVTSDIEDQRIGWQSLEGSDIPNSGVVEFRPRMDRGTEVKVTMIYEAPGGKLGQWAAWALGEEPSLQVADDLRRLKMLMETGEIITIKGQPSGREPLPKPMVSGAAGGGR
jgi:uncharacterized membrane protein